MSAGTALRPRPWADPELFRLLEDSHRRLLGGGLSPDGDEATRVRWVYEEAPYGLLVHDGGADPVFTYANRTAQRCFERGWDTLVGTPSRLSAGPEQQEDRDRLLAQVTAHDVARGYRGLRVAASGRRFWIEDVAMWTVRDRSGTTVGQAAVFPRWSPAPPA